MPRNLWTTIGVGVVILLIAGPPVLAWREQKQMRNFRVVREGVLYRSGQMTVPALNRVAVEYGIRTVVTLRDTPDPRPTNLDRAEDDYCASHDILHVRLSPGAWQNVEDPAAPAPVEENVRKFLAVMADPKNHPVLVHCFAGIHRTGAYTALYRMEFEHWTHDRALEEMRACGYTTLDEEFDILGYLEHFRPTGASKSR